MAITHVSSDKTSATNWQVANSLTVTKPSGTVDDDFMIAIAMRQTATDVITPPGGWTEVDESSPGGGFRQAVWYKIASSEGADYTFTVTSGTNRNGCVAIAAFRGVDTVTPLDVTFVKANHYTNSTSDDTPTPDAITTVTDGAFVLIPLLWSSTTTPTNTPPSGYTVTAENLQNLNRGTAIAYDEITTAGLETPGDYTLTGTTTRASTFTLALKPAAGGTTPKGPLGASLKGPFGGPL